MSAPADLRSRFKSQALLDRALRHRSCGEDCNERLEYLGDALLGAEIAVELYRRYVEEWEDADSPVGEGVLTRLRSELVSTQTLAALARERGLQDALQVAASVGSPSDAMLSGAVEATLGALFIDSGRDAMRRLMLEWWDERLATLPAHPSADTARDAKTRLKERLEKEGDASVRYRVLGEARKNAAERFEISCELSSGERASGRGANRRAAEKAAAAEMLRLLGEGR